MFTYLIRYKTPIGRTYNTFEVAKNPDAAAQSFILKTQYDFSSIESVTLEAYSEEELFKVISTTLERWALEEVHSNPDSNVTYEQRYDETCKTFLEALTDELN